MESVNTEKLLGLRSKTGLNQRDFWAAVGVTQSGGSRYESGREVPAPVVAELIRVYVLMQEGVPELLRRKGKSLL